MIDHVGFPVSDYERSKAFYLKALAPLGIESPWRANVGPCWVIRDAGNLASVRLAT